MSEDCIETYCGGFGQLVNPLQWPQLRKKRRCLDLSVSMTPFLRRLFLPFPERRHRRRQLRYRPPPEMPCRIEPWPPPITAMISSARRSPWRP
ncbi:hypothetical protein FH972_001150 [Carpinus fangiana]|uniref:Uncharacterized protein n=1 Tax=Carpinus fangiana TaxID=176857 RepID=A0A5N6QE05_9ROSI|nr:hypothetical protein FH972_001150 [Carpinus fangiana]